MLLCNSDESLPILILLVIGIAVGMLTGMTGSSGVLIVVPALGILSVMAAGVVMRESTLWSYLLLAYAFFIIFSLVRR